jgi:hypothetical protein
LSADRWMSFRLDRARPSIRFAFFCSVSAEARSSSAMNSAGTDGIYGWLRPDEAKELAERLFALDLPEYEYSFAVMETFKQVRNVLEDLWRRGKERVSFGEMASYILLEAPESPCPLEQADAPRKLRDAKKSTDPHFRIDSLVAARTAARSSAGRHPPNGSTVSSGHRRNRERNPRFPNRLRQACWRGTEARSHEG